VKCLVARGLEPVKGARVHITLDYSTTLKPLILDADVVRVEEIDATTEVIALRFVPLEDPIHDTILKIVLRALERQRAKPRTTVLVVDDEETIRTALTREMRRIARPVIVAATPLEAVRALVDETNAVAVVLVDLGLGASDGLDLVSQIASEYPHVRRVVMSGQRFDDLERAVADGRAHGLLRKPWTKQSLTGVLG
jgi:CheY-like chemotaxis protein